MDRQASPQFSTSDFRGDIDRYSEWVATHVPWKRIDMPKLHQRREFVNGGGWGKNAWGELYQGESALTSYVSVPMKLIEEHNVEVRYKDRSMAILRHAQPDFTRPKSWSSPELIGFYRWMGIPRGMDD